MTRIRITLLVVITLMLFPPAGYGADWKYFGSDDDGSLWYYDTQSVSVGQDTTTVVTKRVMTDKEQKQCIKDYSDTSGIEDITYMLDTVEIKCAEKCVRLLSRSWYDSKDKVLYCEEYPNFKFSEVIPGTMGEKFNDIICKK